MQANGSLELTIYEEIDDWKCVQRRWRSWASSFMLRSDWDEFDPAAIENAGWGTH